MTSNGKQKTQENDDEGLTLDDAVSHLVLWLTFHASCKISKWPGTFTSGYRWINRKIARGFSKSRHKIDEGQSGALVRRVRPAGNGQRKFQMENPTFVIRRPSV